jgi:hypothetical protein
MAKRTGEKFRQLWIVFCEQILNRVEHDADFRHRIEAHFNRLTADVEDPLDVDEIGRFMTQALLSTLTEPGSPPGTIHS